MNTFPWDIAPRTFCPGPGVSLSPETKGMNTGTNLVGAAAPILTPVIKDQYGWPAAWTTAGLLSFAAGLLWLRVGSRSPRLTESQTDPV